MPTETQGFVLGVKSLQELQGVHPDLVRVVCRAIEITPVDFAVHDGIRTEAEQREYVAKGVSKTMKSRHLGGFAVDLVPYVNGKLRWEWPPIYLVAGAMKTAAAEFGQSLRWGGVWDHLLEELNGSLSESVESYVRRRKDMGLSAFIDGPHFELPVAGYPDPQKG